MIIIKWVLLVELMNDIIVTFVIQHFIVSKESIRFVLNGIELILIGRLS